MFSSAAKLYLSDMPKGLRFRLASAETIAAYFKGNAANVLKIAPETACKFTVNDRIKQLVVADGHSITPLERLGCGAAAGAVGQVPPPPPPSSSFLPFPLLAPLFPPSFPFYPCPSLRRIKVPARPCPLQIASQLFTLTVQSAIASPTRLTHVRQTLYAFSPSMTRRSLTVQSPVAT